MTVSASLRAHRLPRESERTAAAPTSRLRPLRRGPGGVRCARAGSTELCCQPRGVLLSVSGAHPPKQALRPASAPGEQPAQAPPAPWARANGPSVGGAPWRHPGQTASQARPRGKVRGAGATCAACHPGTVSTYRGQGLRAGGGREPGSPGGGAGLGAVTRRRWVTQGRGEGESPGHWSLLGWAGSQAS